MKRICAILLTTLSICGGRYDTIENKISSIVESCTDEEYDFDLRCVNKKSLKKYLEKAENGVYRISYIVTYLKDGKSMESMSSGTGIMLQDGYVLASKHGLLPEGVAKEEIIGKLILLYAGEDVHELKEVKLGNEDLALLQIKNKTAFQNFPFEFGDSDKVKVGNIVYIIGNANDNGVCTRKGYVVSKNDEINEDEDYFLIKSKVYDGDSGGAIIAFRDGLPELIGILDYRDIEKDEKNENRGGVLKINRILEELDGIIK